MWKEPKLKPLKFGTWRHIYCGIKGFGKEDMDEFDDLKT